MYVRRFRGGEGNAVQTDCQGALMYTEWAHPMWSPKTFLAPEINPSFVKRCVPLIRHFSYYNLRAVSLNAQQGRLRPLPI